MNLVIVDGDCRNQWTLPELERLLDAGHDMVWFCEDAALRDNGYNAVAASKAAIGASYEKAILVTKLQNGVMDYHRRMFHNTVNCKYWLVVIVGAVSGIYRKQYCDEINSVLGNAVRYGIIFDNPSEMKLALEAKKEIVDDRFLCIIATKSDVQLAEDVRTTMKSAYEDWRFECHVGMEQDDYRYADVILVVGRNEEDCTVPPAKGNASRVKIWLEMPRSCKAEEVRVIDRMNQNGWNLGNQHIWSSCLANEILLQELNHDEISREALCADDRFVMWDQYGLPLPACAYESIDQAVEFLQHQCLFSDLLDNKNGKGALVNAI